MDRSYLRPVTDDLYFIASRLKEIDDTYRVVYNVRRGRYEVHSDAQKGNTLCFVVPYPVLDARTLNYAARTRNPSFGKARGDLDRGRRRAEWSKTLS